MSMTNLPPGISVEQLQAAVTYLAGQQQKVVHRPSGLLQPSQIRGVDPNYRYAFREFPKALTPPAIAVKSVQEEKSLRLKWGQPLPYNNSDPMGREAMDEYYAMQEYPKSMTPPQVVVNDEDEEAAVRASWRQGGTQAELFPLWMFHAAKPAVLVNNRKQLNALGEGWYRTAQEAIDAATNAKPTTTAQEELQRHEIIGQLDKLDVSYDRRMTTARLAALLEEATKPAEEKAA